MKIVFISNFLNHHQLPFCSELNRIIGENFNFIATKKIPTERINMGYKDMNSSYEFVVRSYEDEKKVYSLCNNSDIVIIGSASKKFIKKRLKKNKLTFLYSERIFKNNDYKVPIKKIYYRFIKENFKSKNYYLLCSSAYTANDYNSIGLFNKKTYKWGYFTEVKKYKDINHIINNKKNNSILWVGRFLSWKHPEVPIEIAKRLKNDGYEFTINMIGIGDMYDQISSSLKENNLENCVKLLGAMSPKKVREYMENSKVFLFTSDRGEGWGAVLNESMNSACAVIASHEIGAVPFLIKDKQNGLIYEDGNIDDLYDKLLYLLNNNNFSKKIAVEAYNTMISLWNPKIASERLLELSRALLDNEPFNKYDDGPCSIAEIIQDDWYVRREL